jgi:hypothetical protein
MIYFITIFNYKINDILRNLPMHVLAQTGGQPDVAAYANTNLTVTPGNYFIHYLVTSLSLAPFCNIFLYFFVTGSPAKIFMNTTISTQSQGAVVPVSVSVYDGDNNLVSSSPSVKATIKV